MSLPFYNITGLTSPAVGHHRIYLEGIYDDNNPPCASSVLLLPQPAGTQVPGKGLGTTRQAGD